LFDLAQIIDWFYQAIDSLNKASSTISWCDILVLLVLICSAFLVVRQLRLQTAIFKIDLLKDRITMGWLTDKPITQEDLDNVKYYPKNYIPEKYRQGNDLTGQYLYLDQVYDYFLYVYVSSQSIEDPLGKKWQDMWLTELVSRNDVFNDIKKHQADSFPEFNEFLDDLKKQATKEN